ncbi:hypothetical protein LPJ59_004901 [Coemansia sp. RSA 2399]|nr:hypothetical protein LPJ59_004901 [Coemansia sp. RSA 2399]
MRLFILLMIFAVLLATATKAALKGDDDEDIKGLLGMRPDLADVLDPTDDDGNPHGTGEKPSSAKAGADPMAANDAAIKKQSEEIGCINECKDTDQSCRARCLGVPGVASRKFPRKQDINGNLPLNWRTQKSSCAHGFSPQNCAVVCPVLFVLAWLV